MAVNINTVSRVLELYTTYREILAEMRFRRCMVSIGERVRRDDCDCDSAVAICFTDVCEDNCVEA